MKAGLCFWAAALFLALALSGTAQAEERRLNQVTDAAGLLAAGEVEALERRAQALSAAYGLGLYIIVVDDYRAYSRGDIGEAAERIYEANALGEGAAGEALLLLLSMRERDYSLKAFGPFSSRLFTADSCERLASFFLPLLAQDRWAEGFEEYLKRSGEIVAALQGGQTPAAGSDDGFWLRLAVILLVPLAIASLYIMALTSKMKSVAIASRASGYVSGQLSLSGQSDRYSHSTEIRRRIERPSSEGQSFGGSGGSASGGKF